MTQMQVSKSRPVSTKAEKFSTFPCPYWWSASAGLSETPTEKNVSSEAIRSRPECAASERIPRLPVLNPTTTLSVVMTTAARTEPPAAARFSARIKLDGDMAGFPDMQELSPLRAQSANQIGAPPGLSCESKEDARCLPTGTRPREKVDACAWI